MRTDRSRPFTLIDAMILIAAIAIGLGAGIAVHRLQVARRPPGDNYFRDPFGPDLLPPLPKGADRSSLPQSLEDVSRIEQEILSSPPPMPPPPSKLWLRQLTIQEIVRSTAVFLASCTLGLLALRLRRPRPPIRRLALRPGSTVFVAVIFGAVLAGVAACFTPSFGADRSSHVGLIIEEGVYLFTRSIGPQIVLIWTALAPARRWSVRGWLEWAGLLLGALCVMTFILDQHVLWWMMS